MPDMPDKPDSFQAVPRSLKYRYYEWFVGEMVRLNQPTDFKGEPRVIIAAALRYAQRHGFAAAAAPCLDRNGQPGSVMVWGDPNRPWDEGTPAEVKAEFKKAGVTLRR